MKTTTPKITRQLPAFFVALITLSCIANSIAAETVTEAMEGGKTTGGLRYRYEKVKEDTPVKSVAIASTVRLRLGYETGNYKGLAVKVEAEHLTSLTGNRYDSKANGQTAYSTVADPQFTEINQAYLSYIGIPATRLKYGRQSIVLDNQRFIGNVGWRQNEQTFDAITAVNESLPDTKITLGYIYNVNRIFSDYAIAASGATAGNFTMKSPIINVNYKVLGIGEFVGYGYLLDFTLPANYANSTKTYGLRLNGSTATGNNTLSYTVEYASQSDYKNNPANFSVRYALLEGALDINSANFKLGYELLGSDGIKSFSTPLATLHAFNGWADMFLGTPATGLKDTYVAAGTTLSDIKISAAYHAFSADSGGAKYGTETNVVASKAFGKNYALIAKYARFSTQSAPTRVNTDKIWISAETKF